MGSSEVTRVMAAAVAAGTKGGVEQRYQQPDYIDVSGGTGSPQYELLGFGVTQLDNSPAAKTSSKRYVNQKSATQSIGCILCYSHRMNIVLFLKEYKKRLMGLQWRFFMNQKMVR